MFDSFVELKRNRVLPETIHGEQLVFSSDHQNLSSEVRIGRNIPYGNMLKWYKASMTAHNLNRVYSIVFGGMPDTDRIIPLYVREYVYDTRREDRSYITPAIGIFVPGVNELFGLIDAYSQTQGRWPSIGKVLSVASAIREFVESVGQEYISQVAWAYYTEIADGRYREDFTGLFPIFDDVFTTLEDCSSAKLFNMISHSCVRYNQYPPYLLDVFYRLRSLSDAQCIHLNNACHIVQSAVDLVPNDMLVSFEAVTGNSFVSMQQLLYHHSMIGATDFTHNISDEAELGFVQPTSSNNFLRGYSGTTEGINSDNAMHTAICADGTIDSEGSFSLSIKEIVGTYGEELYLHTYTGEWIVIDLPSYILASGGGLINANNVYNLIT